MKKKEMNKEEIKQEISFRKMEMKSLEDAAQARRDMIAELEKQLSEPELLPCRWCGGMPIYVRWRDSFQGQHRCGNVLCLMAAPRKGDEKENAVIWNEMNDTRPVRILDKDGKRFVEFRVLVNAHDDAIYAVSRFGDINIDGKTRNIDGQCRFGCVVNHEDLKIEVKR